MSASQPPPLSRPAHAAALLRSLTSLAERLRLTQPPHRMEDLERLLSALMELYPFISDATAAPALLSNAAARGALLSVLAVTLRQPLPCAALSAQGDGGGRSTQGHGGGGDGAQLSWVYEGVAKNACVCCDQLMRRKLPPHLAARQVDFALRLLRTQPLHCCARRLATVGAAFLSLERDLQQAGQGPQEPPRVGAASRAAAQAQLARAGQSLLPKCACNVLAESISLVAGLALVTKQPSGKEDARPQAELAQLRGELAAALRDSCVLEHTARTLLLLHGSSLQCPDEDGDEYRHVAFLSTSLDATARLLSAGEPSTLNAALREVLSGRCLQHAVLVLGVTALCAADGGPSHGLPGGLQQRVPLMGQREGLDGSLEAIDLRLANGRQVMDVRALANMVRALGSGDRVAPPGRQGALALLLRVGRLVAASGRTYLGGGGGGRAAAETAVPQVRGSNASGSSGSGSKASGSSGSGCGSSISSSRSSGSGLRQVGALLARPPPPPRLELVLQQENLQPLFSATMQAAMALCFPARPVDRPQRAAARVDCWRLFAAYTRDVLPLRLAGPLPASPLRHLTDPGRLMPGAPLPASPPPSWEAALAGGWLPCLERLLRRGGEDPAGPELVVSVSLLTFEQRINVELVWRHLAVLLAYSEPRQAAAVVATLGKLIRAADPASLAAAALTGQLPPAFMTRWMLAGAFAELCTHTAAAESQAADGPTQGGLPGGAPSAAGRQLARMLSYALCEWLPPLAHLSARVMQAADDARTAESLLHPLLLWLPVIAHRCNATAGGGAAATAGGGGQAEEEGGGGGGDDGGGGASGRYNSNDWRQLLLAEVGVVQLLGAALHSFAGAPPADIAPSMLLNLLRACCAIAAACPREVQAATVAASGGAAAAQCHFPWRPQLLRALAEGLRAQGYGAEAETAEALAAVLDVREAAGSSSLCETGSEAAVCGPPVPPAAWRRVGGVCSDAALQQLASALVPVAEARAVLRTCSYPGCVSLAGDSEAEADAGLQVCGRCGAARYCCAACQAAHWRAGHKRACVRRG